MSNETLIATLKHKDFAISIEELLNGRYQTLLASGLRVVTLCNDGTGRSRSVAEKLNKTGIPAIRLDGGIRNITSNPEFSIVTGLIKSLIGECPTAAVILTQKEMAEYIAFLNNLRAYRYNSSLSAIDSITKMERNVDEEH